MIAVICSVTFGAALSQAFAMERRKTTVTLVFPPDARDDGTAAHDGGSD